MRTLFGVTGVTVALGSLYFFYRGTAFLAVQDYVAASIAILVAFAVLRAGVELARLAHRKGERP